MQRTAPNTQPEMTIGQLIHELSLAFIPFIVAILADLASQGRSNTALARSLAATLAGLRAYVALNRVLTGAKYRAGAAPLPPKLRPARHLIPRHTQALARASSALRHRRLGIAPTPAPACPLLL